MTLSCNVPPSLIFNGEKAAVFMRKVDTDRFLWKIGGCFKMLSQRIFSKQYF